MVINKILDTFLLLCVALAVLALAAVAIPCAAYDAICGPRE